MTREHRDKVASYLDSGLAQGADVLVDGRADPAYAGEGFFLGVSLIDEVTPEMDCYRDEIFGPVLTVVRVPTYADALKLINDNPYGNGTAIFTRDGGAARQFQFDVNAGMVGVNVPIPVPVAYYSFGGWKASLFGDLHMYGPEGIQFYTRAKVVTSRWPDPGDLEGRPGLPRRTGERPGPLRKRRAPRTVAPTGAVRGQRDEDRAARRPGRIGRLHDMLVAAQPEVDEVIVSDVDPAGRLEEGRRRSTGASRRRPRRPWPRRRRDRGGLDRYDARLVAAAIERGLPVFCEKPLAFDLPRRSSSSTGSRLDAIVEWASSAGSIRPTSRPAGWWSPASWARSTWSGSSPTTTSRRPTTTSRSPAGSSATPRSTTSTRCAG